MIQVLEEKVTQELDGERFDIACTKLFPLLSRKQIKKIIDSGGAYLNQKRCSLAKSQVIQGNKVKLCWSEENMKPQKYSLKEEDTLIFEHQDYWIVQKPAGIPSQATLTSSTDTFFHALADCFPQKFSLSSMFLVHRLDKDTSGLMIIARNKKAQAFFENAFRKKLIHKTYHCLCYNIPKNPEGEISYNIEKDSSRLNAYKPVFKGNEGQKAFTKYKILKEFSKTSSSFVACFPETGRTHQVRVHMLSLGCPLLGDKTYGNVLGHSLQFTATRHMLHAFAIEFEDTMGKWRTFECPQPQDFQDCLSKME